MFNFSSLNYLKGNTKKAAAMIHPWKENPVKLKAIHHYHLYMVEDENKWISKAYHQHISNFSYLILYASQINDNDHQKYFESFNSSKRWVHFLAQKSLELANQRDDEKAQTGLRLLMLAQQISSAERVSHDLGSVLAFRHQAYSKAEYLFLVSLKNNWLNAQVYRSYGRLLQRKKNLPLSLSFYELSRRIDPKNYQTYIDMSKILSEKKDWRQALLFLDRAQLINPKQESIYYDKARIWNTMGEVSEAYSQYRQAVSNHPLSPLARYQWGVYAFSQKDFEAALVHLTLAVAFKPEDANSYYYRAQSYYFLEMYSLALKEISVALELKPDQASFKRLQEQILKTAKS